MNEKRDRRGPHAGLLLLIPVAMMVARGARRHRDMAAAWGPGPGAAGGRHGHGSPFWGGAAGDGAAGAFPLPPRIEQILGAWHARAHQAPEPSGPATA